MLEILRKITQGRSGDIALGPAPWESGATTTTESDIPSSVHDRSGGVHDRRQHHAPRPEPLRQVRLGARGDSYVEVIEGVKDGEPVVVAANFLIDAESNLKAALSALTPVEAQP